jgi:outer membrane protein assembly factor BamA
MRVLGVVVGLGLAVGASPAAAHLETSTAETIAELLATSRASSETGTPGRQWAVLPQVGFGPDTGAVGGLKLEHRNVAGAGITLDVDGTYALDSQQSFELEVGSPHLLDDRFLALFRARYYLDPTHEFFGLGNNDVGPDAASTYLFERADGEVTLGWRPDPRVAVSLGIGLRHVHVGRGDRDDDGRPFTLDASPGLPGLGGGFVNPITLSLVWSNRDGVVRPTRGWRAILQVSHTDRALLSDFEYTRWVADVGYLHPLAGGRHVVGARLSGGFIDGPARDTPFWELESLGGDDTLRGYFPERFRGSQRILLNVEWRFRVAEFPFFDIWRVQLDGVAFGEAGRVFTDRGELADEFRLNRSLLSRVVGDLRYSYGGGVRFALSQALVARIDVGFSDEETGLVYLAFGHAF